VLDWIAQSWAKISVDLLVSSFIKCGVGSRSTVDYHSYLKEILENGI
jgi:hypothetical protein